MVEPPDQEVLVAGVLECVNIKETVCEDGDEVSMLVTSVNKELVVVDGEAFVADKE